jgi:hypothetical protein
MGEVFPGKGPSLKPFTFPNFTHRSTVSRDTPRASANCTTLNVVFIRAVYHPPETSARVETLQKSGVIYIGLITPRSSWRDLWLPIRN